MVLSEVSGITEGFGTPTIRRDYYILIARILSVKEKRYKTE